MNILERMDYKISMDFINDPTVLGHMVQKLRKVTYHEKLGTMYDKTLRICVLTEYLSNNIIILTKDKNS